MKRQGQTTPYAVRLKIGELANEGTTDAQIAVELDDNYWTVRKFRFSTSIAFRTSPGPFPVWATRSGYVRGLHFIGVITNANVTGVGDSVTWEQQDR